MNNNDKKSKQSTHQPDSAAEKLNKMKQKTKKYKGWYFVKTY